MLCAQVAGPASFDHTTLPNPDLLRERSDGMIRRIDHSGAERGTLVWAIVAFAARVVCVTAVGIEETSFGAAPSRVRSGSCPWPFSGARAGLRRSGAGTPPGRTCGTPAASAVPKAAAFSRTATTSARIPNQSPRKFSETQVLLRPRRGRGC